MKRMALAGGGLALVFLMTVGSAWAESGIKLCVPKKEGAATLTPVHGKCKKGYKLTSLGVEGKEGKQGLEGKQGSEGKAGAEGRAGAEGKTGPEGKAGLTSSELETLKSILPYIKYVASGVGGKPTIQFSAVNVQVVNGEGKTASVNGEGNLIIGYGENGGKHAQTGSHNLILSEEQTFTSYGGIVAGFENTISGAFGSVLGGIENIASGEASMVSGGEANRASTGGASVSGGKGNIASGADATISGGGANTASGVFAWIGGGDINIASEEEASVSGGYGNNASGPKSSIFGGKELKATKEYEAIP
jgi:collagen triple helix repeat protein